MMKPSSERRIKHYSNFHQILLVGEGDFSFSSVLANAFGSAENMVPTSLDSREKVVRSYESGLKNLQNLERCGAMILHGVDATTMDKLESIRERKFDRIIFNFPHAGFFGKEEDQKVIKKHSHLVDMFFRNARTMLSSMGEIHVTHKEYYPYSEWKVVEVAGKNGMVLKESVEFKREDYSGYANRRGSGSNIGDTFILGNCRTYMFIQSLSIPTESPWPKSYCEAYLESLEEATLVLESARRARKAAEIANFNLETSFEHLKTFSSFAIKENNEFKRQRDDALHQKDEALREKTMLAEALNEYKRQRDAALHQKDEALRERTILAEVLRSKDYTIYLKDISLMAASLVFEFERQGKKEVEPENSYLETSLNHLKTFEEALKENGEFKRQRDAALHEKDRALKENGEFKMQRDAALHEKDKALKENGDFKRQRDAALQEKNKALKKTGKFQRQRDAALQEKDKAVREVENIAKELAEALSLKEEAIKQKDVSLERALMELEFERQARKAAETAKADLEASFENYSLSVSKELDKLNKQKRNKENTKAKHAKKQQGLEASSLQKEEVCRPNS